MEAPTVPVGKDGGSVGGEGCGPSLRGRSAGPVRPSSSDWGRGGGTHGVEWGATCAVLYSPEQPQRSPVFQTPVPFSLPSGFFQLATTPLPLLSGQMDLKVPRGLGGRLSPWAAGLAGAPPPRILD